MSVRKPAATKAAARKPTTTSKRVAKPRSKAAKQNVWDKIIALGKTIPEEELENFPKDGARNLEHYLYGAPKQYPTADGYTGNTMSVREPAATKAAARKPAAKPKRAAKPRAKAAEKNIWDRVVELGKQIPDDELKNWPRDGAKNTDHYLDGSPKQY